MSYCRCTRSLTVGFQRERCRRTQNTRVSHRVLHQTDVAPHVWRLHLGNVQVSRVLGDEAAAVLGNEGGELVKDPAVDDLWGHKSREDRWHRSCLADALGQNGFHQEPVLPPWFGPAERRLDRQTASHLWGKFERICSQQTIFNVNALNQRSTPLKLSYVPDVMTLAFVP